MNRVFIKSANHEVSRPLRGLTNLLPLILRACAPGFMLSRAPRALLNSPVIGEANI
jgi:hypothetical protein